MIEFGSDMESCKAAMLRTCQFGSERGYLRALSGSAGHPSTILGVA